MSGQEVDKSRRGLRVATTSVLGGIATGVTSVPFVGSMFPSERAKAAGAPVEAKGEMGMEWNGGFYCPCHGSKFDFAGRVFKSSPAPVNLIVPPHKFVGDAKIVIGDDTRGA